MEKNKAVLAKSLLGKDGQSYLHGPYDQQEAEKKKRELDAKTYISSMDFPKPFPYWQTQIVTLTF